VRGLSWLLWSDFEIEDIKDALYGKDESGKWPKRLSYLAGGEKRP